MISFFTLALCSLMGVFVVPHPIKHIFAKASKDDVLSLCIPFFVIYFIALKMCGISRFWETLRGGSKIPTSRASK